MSKFSKSALVGAIALAISGAAFAGGDVTLPSDAEEYVFAWELTNGNDVTADTPQINYAIETPDILIGRTDDTGQVTVFATINGADLRSAVEAGDITVAQGTLDSVSSAPGGSSFQFVITPPAAETAGFTADSLFSISGLALEAAQALQAEGGEVTISFEVKDTTTGTLLSSAPTEPVLTSATATEIEIEGEDPNVIDVMADKLLFVGDEDEIELGVVHIHHADVNGNDDDGDQYASAAGANSTGNVGCGGNFIFDAFNDTVEFSLTVPETDPFELFWVDRFYCGWSGSPTVFEVDEDDATLFTATAPLDSSGEDFLICGEVDGETEIAAQTIGLSVQVDLDHASTRDPAEVTSIAFNVLRYNGAVEQVWHFNPASNPNQMSYLRITNTSAIDGLVEIDSICDNGTAAPGQADLTLESGHSVLLTSRDVVDGNVDKGVAGGVGICPEGGKHRLTLTAQFATMEVQNFLRNYTSVGQVNTNVENDGDDDGTLDEFVKQYLDMMDDDGPI